MPPLRNRDAKLGQRHLQEQSFIVRFYRFDPQKPGDVVGTVQAPESEARLRFTGKEDLWQAMVRLVEDRWDAEKQDDG
jgi:hypothetical protein